MPHGICDYKDSKFLFVDLPGTYSIMSNSEEEEIARNYICFENPDVTVVVVDATSLERNLNLVLQIKEITPNIIVCVNLIDEAKKKGIKIDISKLENLLHCKVVSTIARKKRTLNNLLNTIYNFKVTNNKDLFNPIKYSDIIENAIQIVMNEMVKIKKIPLFLKRFTCIKLLDNSKSILKTIESKYSLSFSKYKNLQKALDKSFAFLEENGISKSSIKDEIVTDIVNKSAEISKQTCIYENTKYRDFDIKLDKILTSKKFGIPIMIIFLCIIFWLTIVGSNYPSQVLFSVFSWLQNKLLGLFDFLHSPEWLKNMLVLGVYQTLTWIISVMLPPMAIFFPLFTFLEDLGFLPRIAFNMDGFFSKAKTSGKQMITMCMVVTKWD